MKKNRMMRLASILLVCVLLTTSVISGTFAKYTTQDSASDSARVAKWGVTVLASGTLFGEHYNKATETNGNEIATTSVSVASFDADTAVDNIVAPGTQNTTGLNLAISGTPEVQNTIAVSKGSADHEEIFLAKGTYATLVKTSKVTEDNFETLGPLFTVSGTTYTLAGSYDSGTQYYAVHDVVTFNNDYYPVVFTWTPSTGSAATYTTIDDMYSVISTYFSGTNDANSAIDKSGVITWVWGINQNDGADTILGNLMAKAADQVVVKYTAPVGSTPASASAVTDGTDYNLTTNFDITITATQED